MFFKDNHTYWVKDNALIGGSVLSNSVFTVTDSKINGIYPIFSNTVVGVDTLYEIDRLLEPDDVVSIADVVGSSGLWIDPSQRSALFQDGTIPVTAPGQPVGLIRDLSGHGNHASQAVALNRPILGRHPASGLRNRVRPTSEALSQWISGVSVTVVDNTPGGSTITAAASTAQHGLISARGDVPSNVDITVTLEAKAGTETLLILQPQGASPSHRWTYQVNLTTGVVTSLGGAGEATNAGAVSESLADGWWKITLKMKPQAAAGVGVALRAFVRTEAVWTAAGTETLQVRKVQIETGTTSTAYQTVTSAYDVTEPGFSDVWYLATDGVDDWLLTPSITWATDEVTLIVAIASNRTGVQSGVFRGGGDASPTRFGMVKQSNDRMNINSAGSVTASVTHATEVSGSAEIYTMTAKIGGPALTLRHNGAVSAQTTTTQGTGVYQDSAVNIAAWGGGQFFAGRIYGLMAINRVLSPSELARVEAYFASRAGVSLAES